MPKQFSPASERNKVPILNVLRRLFSEPSRILEIGSGTGQHAVWFSYHLPQITWQPSDRANAFQDLSDSLPTETPSNLLQPIRLDVAQNNISELGKFDAVYTANTLHIMSWAEVGAFIQLLPALLFPNGIFVAYGPFNYAGKYTNESNEAFDQMLRNRDPLSGIRDFEALDGLLSKAGFKLNDDEEMPANNRLICWKMSEALGSKR